MNKINDTMQHMAARHFQKFLNLYAAQDQASETISRKRHYMALYAVQRLSTYLPFHSLCWRLKSASLVGLRDKTILKIKNGFELLSFVFVVLNPEGDTHRETL